MTSRLGRVCVRRSTPGLRRPCRHRYRVVDGRAATPMYEEAPISYSATAPQDPVAAFKASLEHGETKITPVAKRGYLDALLAELKISPASQMLVFSKTSFQRNAISPKNPRAMYFNDDTYVGYVPGGDVLEIASVDPNARHGLLHPRTRPKPRPRTPPIRPRRPTTASSVTATR